MPRGDRDAYTRKQKRQAARIERSHDERGVGADEAERRAWVTVNEQDGGRLADHRGRRRRTSGTTRKAASR